MIEVKEHLPERDSEQVQKIKCMCTNTIVVYKTVEKKSKLSDIVWDLHLVKDLIIGTMAAMTLANIAVGIIIGLFLIWTDCHAYLMEKGEKIA